MKSSFFSFTSKAWAFIAIICFFSFVPLGIAAPFQSDLDTKIDTYLTDLQSPLAGNGEIFFSEGESWNVDPRLVVAISGQEQNFGKDDTSCNRIYNAWSWFYGGRRCATNPSASFDSWAQGIETVTKYLRKSYFDRYQATTIPAIGKIYCTEECGNWAENVEHFYQSDLAGDPNDLTFSTLLQSSSCDIANPKVPCEIDGITYDTFAGNYSQNRVFYKASSYDVSISDGFLCLSIKSGLPHNDGYTYSPGRFPTVWTSPPPYNVSFGIFGSIGGACIAQADNFEWIGVGAQSNVLEDFESYPVGDWQNGNSNVYGQWLSCDTNCDRMQITEDGWFDHVYERGSAVNQFIFSTSTGLFSGVGIERVSWDVVLSDEGWYPGGEWVADWNQVLYYIANGGYGGDHSAGVYAGFCQSADKEGEYQFYILDNSVSNNCSGQVKVEGATFLPNTLYTVTVEVDNDRELIRAGVNGQWTNWIPTSTSGITGIQGVVFTPLGGHKYDNIRGGRIP